MNEADQLRDRLLAAAPEFAPIAPHTVHARARRRHRGMATAAFAGTAVVAGAVLVAPRLVTDPPRDAPPVASAPSSAPSSVPGSVPRRACPPPGDGTAIVDYADVVSLLGGHYLRHDEARVVPDRPVGTVLCTIADIEPDPSYLLVDGDATFLPRGTTLHSVRNLPRWFRLATADGRYYDVRDVAGARTGGQLLPLRGVVASIEVFGPDDRPRRRITNPAQVGAVVDAVLAGPVVPRSEAPPGGRVRFRLTDGTTVERSWVPATRLLDERIRLRPAAAAILG